MLQQARTPFSKQQGLHSLSALEIYGCAIRELAFALAFARTLDIDSAGKTLRLVSALGIQFLGLSSFVLILVSIEFTLVAELCYDRASRVVICDA